MFFTQESPSLLPFLTQERNVVSNLNDRNFCDIFYMIICLKLVFELSRIRFV